MGFKKATKEQSLLRLFVHGPSGSGKTRTALGIMLPLIQILTPGKRLRYIDTERGSASKYVGKEIAGFGPADFDVEEIYDDYHPSKLTKALTDAIEDGECGGIVIDSLTHFWKGTGGILELVDKEAKRIGSSSRSGKSDGFSAWKVGDKHYRDMIDRILESPTHVYLGARSKQEHVKGEDGKIRKMGLSPEVRDGAEYEFDLEAQMDMDHNMIIGKTRFDSLDGQVILKPGKDVAIKLVAELRDGVERKPRQKTEPTIASQPAEGSAYDDGGNALARYTMRIARVTDPAELNTIYREASGDADVRGDAAVLIEACKVRKAELMQGAA